MLVPPAGVFGQDEGAGPWRHGDWTTAARCAINLQPTVKEPAQWPAFSPVFPSSIPSGGRIIEEAEAAVIDEPLLGGVAARLHPASFKPRKRAGLPAGAEAVVPGEMSEQILREIADEAYGSDPGLGNALRGGRRGRRFMTAIRLATAPCKPAQFFFKGFQAVQAYRVGIGFWQAGAPGISAYFIQMRVSEVFGIDIHPAARIGKGIMIDHAHSIVIGETAVVGDNVSMLHSVTLGGTGKETEDRHPKDRGRRADRGGCEGLSGQYPDRKLQPHRRRLCGAGGGSAVQDRGRGAGANRGRSGL